MADYWKSNPRKFCEFCKCWTIDNKASRDFHERGKRHQENVRLKISELKRKGLDDARKEKETSQLMIDIEKAALSQFRKDMQQNPSLASQYGIDLDNKSISFDTKIPDADKPDDLNGWEEVIADDGKVYYWNSVTNESSWDLPNASAKPSTFVKSKTHKRKSEKGTQIKIEPTDNKPVVNNKHEISNWNIVGVKNDLNIKSETVEEAESNFLELPVDTLSHAVTYATDAYSSEDVELLEFKEKIVPTKTLTAPVAFKKRKINRNNKQNSVD